jgi:hypothetical protein
VHKEKNNTMRMVLSGYGDKEEDTDRQRDGGEEMGGDESRAAGGEYSEGYERGAEEASGDAEGETIGISSECGAEAVGDAGRKEEVTTDERIEALLKSSEAQGKTIDKILVGMDKISANFREFQEDRNQINRSMATLIERVDKLAEKIDRQTDNIDRLEKFFERSLTKPPNGKTKGSK